MSTYADQRAHDVMWMTAAERAELDAPASPVCAKCSHPVMKSWGGWGHAPGRTDRRRHVVVVAENRTP